MVTKRLSLILASDDVQRITPFTSPGTDSHHVLQRWATVHGVGPLSSEAAAIRALLQAGVEALQEEVLDQAYVELAQTFHGGSERADRRAARDRYVRRTESHA